MSANLVWLALAAALVASGSKKSARPRTRGAEDEPDPVLVIGGLEVLEVFTGGAATADDLPVVVLLHGRGGTPESLLPFAQEVARPARWILPRAPHSLGGGRAWWEPSTLDSTEEDFASAIEASGSVELVAGMLAELIVLHGRRPLLVGWSQGAELAYAIAATRGELTSAVIALAGWLPSQWWPDPGQALPPVVGLHGDADEVVPYDFGLETITAFEDAGGWVEWLTSAGTAHAIQPIWQAALSEALVPVIEVENDYSRPGAEPWEVEAALVGSVGAVHSDSEDDQVEAVGSGGPEDFCMPILGAGADELEPHLCVVDPASHPDFEPQWRGVPQAHSPSLSVWPIITQDPRRLVVSYWSASGLRGHGGRTFGTTRADDDGTPRHHAGVDLFADEDDIVVAPEDGHILAILPFHAGSYAVYLRSMLGDRVVNLGEVKRGSWREFGVAKGTAVQAGQPVARIAKQEKSTMLHLEIGEFPESMTDEDIEQGIRTREWAWFEGDDPPGFLRDPSGYLITAAHRTWQREQLGF